MWTEKTENTGNSNRQLDYLPKSPHGSILFTTRSRKAATMLAANNVILITEMNEATGMDLLEKSLSQRPITDDQAAINLLRNLTYLPLAIIQAAAYINGNAISLAEYNTILNAEEQDVIDLLSVDFEDEGRYGADKNPIATTWLISFKRIQKADPLAAEYLAFMSCVDAKNIPQSILPKARTKVMATTAIGTLTAYSFVAKHSTGQLFDIHRLVHLATRNWLRMQGTFKEWAVKAIEQLAEVFPDDIDTTWDIWKIYLPHARYALSLECEAGRQRAQLLHTFGRFVLEDGRYTEAENAFLQIIDMRKQRLGADFEQTLRSMSYLTLTYRRRGQLKEAEELQLQDLEKRKQKLGADHLDTLTSMNNLAVIYSDQGRLKEAEELKMQVLEKRKQKLGTDHPDTLISMNNLAAIYNKQGQLKEAEELHLQVLEKRKQTLEEHHPDTLVSMSDLAMTYANQGQLKEAEELHLLVLEKRKQKLGADHPDTLTTMNNLAMTYWDQGQLKDAEELHLQVLEKWKQKLEEDYPNTLTSMENLSALWKDMGRNAEAMDLLQKCVQIRESIFAVNHRRKISF